MTFPLFCQDQADKPRWAAELLELVKATDARRCTAHLCVYLLLSFNDSAVCHACHGLQLEGIMV